HIPYSCLKSYIGHSLGACGALEAWLGAQMMNENWFSPNLNLDEVDENCGQLDYIRNDVREIKAHYFMSNNFAFGGVNTSLIFKRVYKNPRLLSVSVSVSVSVYCFYFKGGGRGFFISTYRR